MNCFKQGQDHCFLKRTQVQHLTWPKHVLRCYPQLLRAYLTQCTAFSETHRARVASEQRSHGRQQARSAFQPPPSNTRKIVLEMLERIHRSGAYANLLSEGLEGSARAFGGKADPADIRRATHLTSGVTRWRLQLDWLVEHFANRPLHRLDDSVLQVLRLGLFELVHAQSSAHAVNEFVNLVKQQVRRGNSQAVGNLVNAVLRSAVRAREAGKLPQMVQGAPDTLGQPPMSASRAASVRHSHPEWLVARWMLSFGAESLEALLTANNRLPRYAVRVAGGSAPALQEELLQQDIVTERSGLLPNDFLVVSSMQKLLQGGWLASGRCQVQDEAAGLVVNVLDPQPGEHVLDACAAPGGKSLFAASRMAGQGSLLALDISASRLGLLQTAASQQKLDNIISTCATSLQNFATDPACMARVPPGGFDKVLLDVPCSGTGVLAKRADLRWKRSGRDLQELVALQAELLQAAAGLVRPGGVLVYSTCSLEPEENHQQIASLVEKERAGFAVQAPSGISSDLLSDDGYLVMLPHVHGTDGAFAARLQRRS